jgi:DNA polymerase-4
MTSHQVMYVRFLGLGKETAEEKYPALLRLLDRFTPVVQPIPPDAALADLKGAVRYFGLDAVWLARLVRVRALALHGTDCAIGVAVNPLLARMAAALPQAPEGLGGAPIGGAPGVFAVPGTQAAITGFLAPKPPAALHGVGPATARALRSFGLDTIGKIAATPPATLQRILGAAQARRVHALAHGIDPTPVTPTAPPRSTAAELRFGHDELDPHARRSALLALADELGYRLRGEGQVARALTLTVRYADHTATTRTRALAEPTAHTPALVSAAYALHDALGLQRARVRALGLRAEDLADADHAPRQLSLDPADERRRRAEEAADRARRRFGRRAAGPAAGRLDAA